jgi:Xaa-Pro aminopeptidase
MPNTFMDRRKIIAYSDAFVGRADKNGYDAIIDFLHDRGHAKRGIGHELGALSALAVEKFKARLPDARIQDGSRLVDWVRFVKSDLEIAATREAAFYRTIESLGVRKETRCGYPIGIDWVGPTASHQAGDTTELKPTMSFHLTLGNRVDEDFGDVLSETFRVTETDAEVLTKAPGKIVEL